MTKVNAQSNETDSLRVNSDLLSQALELIGLRYTPSEIDSALSDVDDNLTSYEALRENLLPNAVPPALYFNPLPNGMTVPAGEGSFDLRPVEVEAPERLEDLAFYSVRDLAELLRTQRVTSTELTKLALDRLKKHDTSLHCVVTLTEETALREAAQADEEIAAGNYRGPLHGIPYGAKDLLAYPGYPTTWGATTHKDQTIDETAAVLAKLDSAGAVLVAKLTLGALAWGDVWFGEKTRNPWNLEQGSSGSSAGPASAVVAGLVPFAIGSETWGSIVSPSTRCGASGLRPTYGTVSRAGAMALSWSMDKLGPICRTVEDCAIVYDAIHGSDPADLSVSAAPFNYSPEIDFASLRVGYLKSAFDSDTVNTDLNTAALKTLRDLGAELIEIELPAAPIMPLSIILVAEAAAAFQELTLNNTDDLLVRQIKNAWPNVFRTSQLIPAVEYIQANRHRTRLINEMAELMARVDIYVTPPFGGDNLLLTNLTGHPCVVVPHGFNDKGLPRSITFMGQLYDDGRLLAFAQQYQQATDHHKRFPPLFSE